MSLVYEILLRGGLLILVIAPWITPTLWTVYKRWDETRHLMAQVLNCPACSGTDRCDEHEYQWGLLHDHGAESYRDYVAWQARRDKSAIIRLAMKHAHESKQSERTK